MGTCSRVEIVNVNDLQPVCGHLVAGAAYSQGVGMVSGMYRGNNNVAPQMIYFSCQSAQ